MLYTYFPHAIVVCPDSSEEKEIYDRYGKYEW